VLLYFWASWCPICRAEEPGIRAAVEAMDVPVAGFRVNFDVESALKKQFKIPYQHTTVILDTRGQESSRFSGPVDGDTLRAAIRAAAK
ncbi:thioredoxin family protein, partial [Candidatus Uhrbacteria bacterium]|nr:thioredoxin family protein [Candidatus Uhrbacteria bacterium]